MFLTIKKAGGGRNRLNSAGGSVYPVYAQTGLAGNRSERFSAGKTKADLSDLICIKFVFAVFHSRYL